MKSAGILWGIACLLYIATACGNDPAADTTPPVLVVTSPTDTQEVGETFQATGTVTDAGGVAVVYHKLNDGAFGAVALTGGTWTTNITLPSYGYHTNYFYARDSAGNESAVQAIVVERTSVPSLLVTNPANGTITNTASITLEGTAAIDAPYALISIELNHNSGGWVAAVGAEVWSGIVNLQEGTNTILVRAIADNGKIVTNAPWTIVYNPPVPLLAITSHADGVWVPESPVAFYGTASIEEPYSVTNVAVSLNGGAWVTATGTTTWNVSLSLQAGTNTVRVRATADNGKATESPLWTLTHGNEVCVATDGLDSNFGTKTHPVKTLQTAITIAAANGITNIFVRAGHYTAGNGLNESVEEYSYSGIYVNTGNLNFYGGWNSGYTLQDGVSILNGFGLRHVVWITAVDRVRVDNFVICNGAAMEVSSPHNGGGGLYLNGNRHRILNCVISNNQARTYGGGIRIYRGEYHEIDSVLVWNTAQQGGAIFINDHQARYHSIAGSISNNTSSYGGGVNASGSTFSISATISSNTSAGPGGGLHLAGSGHSITSIIGNNNASQFGGGVYLNGVSTSTIGGIVRNNISPYSGRGGGIFSNNGNGVLFNGLIVSNQVKGSNPNGNGGGIFFNRGNNNIILSEIRYNLSDNPGAGVYMDQMGTNNAFRYPVHSPTAYALIEGHTNYGLCIWNTMNMVWTSGIIWGTGNTPGNQY